MDYAQPLAQLMQELEKLPGIGPKSAQRLAFWLLKAPAEEAEALAQAIHRVKSEISHCCTCFNFTTGDTCRLCSDDQRDHSLICVVGEPHDVIALERGGDYHGVYHVLQGLLSPLEGVGPEELRIQELVDRVRSGEVRETILATSPTPEGEATAEYIRGLLSDLDVKVTRIGLGLPIGGELDYADDITIARAIEGRREM
ncbi:MAG: recombination mediator RecR [Armatimonadota bacterium]